MVDLKELKKKANIPAIVGQYVELRQQGAGYVACCPFHEEKTPSFHLDNKKGDWLWHCFGKCNEGGDVVRFIEKAAKCDTKTAIEKFEAIVTNRTYVDTAEKINRQYSQIGKSEKTKTTFTMGRWEKYELDLWNKPEALTWLREVRGLHDEIIRDMHLGFSQEHIFRIDADMEHTRKLGWIMFPRIFKNSEGTERVVGVKFRSIADKAFSAINNMDSSVLFNVETINGIQPIYLVEGELDACTMEQAGFRTVSLPNGSKSNLSSEMRVRLKTAERIFLAGDTDETGTECMKKILRELSENTHWLLWPEGKDASDFFRSACGRDIEKFRNEVDRLSLEAKNAPPEGFAPLTTRLRQTQGTDLGNDPNRLRFPPSLASSDRMTYTPRGGICIIYSTYSGTGKSMLKSQLLLYEAKRGEVVVDLSPEIRDDEYLALITSQTMGPYIQGGLRRTGKMDKQHFLEAADKLDKPTERGGEFRYYVGHNVLGQSEDEILEFLENTIRTLGCTRFAIDTFHRLIFADGKGSQVQAEGSMIKKLEILGNKYGTIFLLICQSNAEAEGIDNLKKNEHGVLRGSREIRDVPASIYLLHRNRRSQKDGEDPDDILELEANLFAKKTRFKGPGKPQVKLLLKEEHSLFVELATNAGPEPAQVTNTAQAPILENQPF